MLCFAFCENGIGQRIAIIAPESSTLTDSFAEKLEGALAERVRTLDREAALAAFRSQKVDMAFNLSSSEAIGIGDVTGCDHFVILKAESMRRTSSSRPNYYEAFIAIFLVDSRNGTLEQFILESKQGGTAAEAEGLLLSSVPTFAETIIARSKAGSVSSDNDFPPFDADSKTMRPAMPYKRVKPEYTQTAYLYGIAATVDAEVSIDANGNVKRIDIKRWAGYGLDESVAAAIRQMNWRPGEKNGKPLPMRVLLRYNFTKIEKEQ